MVQAGITVRWTGPGPHFSKALRELRALHSERWRAKGQPGLFPAKREVLLEKYAASAVAVNGPWILTFLRDESPVAALLGFRFGDSFSVYKTGWSPDVAKLGPGMALGQEAMRWAEEQGLHTFDYLRGPGPHKAELGCRPREDVSVIRVRGITGQLINLREQSDHSIRRAVRRFY
jgi:CelD/BcsL family acetyltransferase involved in cellulose biosynthesis